MKESTQTLILSLSLLILLGLGGIYVYQGGMKQAPAQLGAAGTHPATQPATRASGPLTAGEIQYLVYMREEEKLARDLYRHFFTVWNNPVFANIAQAEQLHTDAIRRLLLSYKWADPVLDDTPGVFQNSHLADLYQQLFTKGNASLSAALAVGGLVEEVDMADLDTAVQASTHPDIVQTYQELLRGSRNHLRAFAAQLEHQGIPYEAQYLQQSAVDPILDAPMERRSTAPAGPGARARVPAVNSPLGMGFPQP